MPDNLFDAVEDQPENDISPLAIHATTGAAEAAQPTQRQSLLDQFNARYRQSISPGREFLANMLMGVGAGLTHTEFRSAKQLAFDRWAKAQQLQESDNKINELTQKDFYNQQLQTQKNNLISQKNQELAGYHNKETIRKAARDLMQDERASGREDLAKRHQKFLEDSFSDTMDWRNAGTQLAQDRLDFEKKKGETPTTDWGAAQKQAAAEDPTNIDANTGGLTADGWKRARSIFEASKKATQRPVQEPKPAGQVIQGQDGKSYILTYPKDHPEQQSLTPIPGMVPGTQFAKGDSQSAQRSTAYRQSLMMTFNTMRTLASDPSVSNVKNVMPSTLRSVIDSSLRGKEQLYKSMVQMDRLATLRQLNPRAPVGMMKAVEDLQIGAPATPTAAWNGNLAEAAMTTAMSWAHDKGIPIGDFDINRAFNKYQVAPGQSPYNRSIGGKGFSDEAALLALELKGHYKVIEDKNGNIHLEEEK